MRVKKILFSLIFALLGIMCVTGSVFLLQGCSQSTSENGGGGISENPESEDPDDPNDKPTEMQSHIESTLTKYVQNTSGQYLEATGGGSATIVYDFVLNGYDSTDWDIPGITLGLNDSSASGRCTTSGDPWTNRWRSKITATAAEHFSFFKYDGKYSNGSDWVSVTKTDNPYIQDDIITTDSGIWGTSYINLNILFSRNKYTVYFDPNGGSGSISLRYVYYQASVGTLPTAVRNGYSFTGWYTAASGGSKISSSTTITKSVTYYAHWSANTYKVTLNANGGSGGTTAVWFKYGTNTYYSNSSCTTTISSITKPTRTGYTYDTSKGFYIKNAVNGASDGERYIAYESVAFASDLCTDIYSDVTLICNWTINTYRLSINYYSSATNRPQLTTTSETCYVADETLSAPTTNSSYTFTYITHTYTMESQAITFKLNSGGAYSYYLRLNQAPTTTEYHKLFTSVTDTYTFDWTPVTDSTINIYVYQRYSISYISNHGSGTTPSTQYKIHGTPITLGTNSLTRTSYTANGWNTDSSGTGTQYISGATYSDNTASRTLYANWTPKTCTLNVKIMTSTNGSTYTNSVTGGSISYGYKYSSNNTIVSTSATVKVTSSSNSSVLISQVVTFTPTANTGYVFAGISTSTSAPYNTTNLSFTPTTQGASYTYYAYFNKLSGNIVKYVSKNSATYSDISVSNISGHQFKQKADGFWESQNWGIHNSYALAKVSFTLTNTANVVFDVINYAESAYDFGIFSNLNSTLTSSNTADSTNVKKSFKGLASSAVQNVIYENVSPGTYYVYVKYRKDGSANTNNDSLQFRIATEISNDSYYYFEDGYFPQSYVGDALNSTLSSTTSITFDRNLKYFDASGNTISIPIYTYSGVKYAKVTKNSVTKWFKMEKIKWRLSDYDGNVTNTWIGRGKFNSNIKVVSDRVLWVGAVSRDNTKEGWSFNSSNMRTYFAEIYKKNGASVSGEMPTFGISYNEKSYYYGPAGQQEKVKYTTSSYTGINIATEEEIKINLTDLRAKASDMVAFILGLNEDSYCDYWTRELGGSLKNGKIITNSGMTKSAWLQNFYGVRFSLRMSEGSRV